MDYSMPGIGTTKATAMRRIMASMAGAAFLPAGRTIDGANSRDPLNTGDVDVLRAGMIMGLIRASGKYAPSIIGKLTAVHTSGGATLTVSVATGTEMDRRVAAGGTFNLVGPPLEGGIARKIRCSYSGTAIGGTVTLAVNAAVAEVQTVTTALTPDGGTYTLSYMGHTTAAIAWNANAAAIKLALELLPSVNFGDITASAALANATTFTFATTLGNVPLITADTSLMLDGAVVINDLVIAETTPGELGAVATTGITCVQTVTLTNLAAGNVKIRLTNPLTGEHHTTIPMAHDAALATIETNITNAIGSNTVAVSGTDIDAFIMTFDDVTHEWANMPVPLVDIIPDTAVTNTVIASVVMTTVGRDGRFPTGSLVMPDDGSDVPLSFIIEEYGIKVTDDSNVSKDVMFPRVPIGGTVKSGAIINYPTESSTQRWLKDQLNAIAPFVFDDDYNYSGASIED